MRRFSTSLFALVLVAWGAVSASAGVMTSVWLNGIDADTGIRPGANYTHVVDFDPAAVPATVNGVAFNQTAQTGTNYALTGAPSPYTGTAGLTGFTDLVNDFYYDGPALVGDHEVLTLTGLSPNTSYTLRMYMKAWSGNRTADVLDSDGATLPGFNQDGKTFQFLQNVFTTAGSGPNSTQFSMDFTVTSGGSAQHIYGFTNEVGAAVTVAQTGSSSGSAYTVATGDLLETSATLTSASGVGQEEGITSTDLSILADGQFGGTGSGGRADSVAIHNGAELIYTLAPTPLGLGYDITQIDSYTGWQDGGRDDQLYTVMVATVDDPDSFVPLVTTQLGSGDANTALSLVDLDGGLLATNAAKLKFFFPSTENGFVGYREFDVFGAAVVPEPSTFILMAMSAVAGLVVLGWRRRRR